MLVASLLAMLPASLTGNKAESDSSSPSSSDTSMIVGATSEVPDARALKDLFIGKIGLCPPSSVATSAASVPSISAVSAGVCFRFMQTACCLKSLIYGYLLLAIFFLL